MEPLAEAREELDDAVDLLGRHLAPRVGTDAEVLPHGETGGDGVDNADGGAGTDTCDAEVSVACNP
jgi:hypothetical protein